MDNSAIETIRKLVETEQNKGEIISQLLEIYSETLQDNYEAYKSDLAQLQKFDQELTKAVASLDSAFQYQRQLRTHLFTETLAIEKQRLDAETQTLREKTDLIVAKLTRQPTEKRRPIVESIVNFLTGLRR